MARRHQDSRPSGGKSGPEALQCEVQRLIDKGNAKEAFKLAKTGFRASETPENRRLVEQTYLLRVQELARGGMTMAGREVVGSMLEFGVSNPDLLQELILVLPQLGLADKALALQAKLGPAENQADLSIKIADRAVLHPEETSSSLPELRAEAALIRDALTALEGGSETRALELLQGIARHSPLADWRLFVRGLAAWRRGDTAQAGANWDRLAAGRPASRIVAKLRTTVDSQTINPDVESHVLGEPVSERIVTLQGALEADDWRRVFSLAGPLQKSLRRVDAGWADRLTLIVLDRLVESLDGINQKVGESRVAEFKRVFAPLPWDPRWSRLDAIVFEYMCEDPMPVLRQWRVYIDDLEAIPSLSPAERVRYQLLVWFHMAELAAEDAEEIENSLDDDEDEYGSNSDQDSEGDTADDSTVKIARQFALESLDHCLKLSPGYRAAHQLRLDLLKQAGLDESLPAALRLMHEAFPQDLNVLFDLIECHRTHKDVEEALAVAGRIRAINPAESRVDSYEIWARLESARRFALNGRIDEARVELSRASELPEQVKCLSNLTAQQIVLEFKAKQTDEAERLLDEAKKRDADPTGLWLQLAVEAARHKLPKPMQVRFNNEVEAGLARKVRSETAASLAGTMHLQLLERSEYTGRAGHLKAVITYLQRTTRIKYSEIDLRRVHAFLKTKDPEDKLLRTLINRGSTLFPDCAIFQFDRALLDSLDVSRDPTPSLKRLKKALALATASPIDQHLIPAIEAAISAVEEAIEERKFRRGGFGFFERMFRPRFESNADRFDDGYDDEWTTSGGRKKSR